MMEEQINKPVILYYWDTRGLAERIRILLNYCQLPYKEVRYTKQTQSDWFNVKKPEVYKRYSAVSLPLLQDHDNNLNIYVSQYQGICTYICLKAKKQQLLGRNIDQKTSLSTALSIFRDAYYVYRKYVYEQYGKGDKQQISDNKQYFKLLIRKHLNRLANLRMKNTYLCGDQLVWMDLVLVEFLQCLTLMESPQILADLDHWKQYLKLIWSLPQVEAYLKSQKFKEKPCNNYNAKWI